MRKWNAIGIGTVGCLAAIGMTLLAHMTAAYRQSIHYKVRSMTSISSEDALADLIGKPDGVTNATPGIEDLPETRCLVYKEPLRPRFVWNRKFPFVKKYQSQEYLHVHILGQDKLGRIDHINNNLTWGPVDFNRAIVVLEYELSPRSKMSSVGSGQKHNLNRKRETPLFWTGSLSRSWKK